jgi:hypothetical protein
MNDTQVKFLRERFKTKKIFSLSDKREFSENEIQAIIVAIKENKRDGTYPINDEISVVLEKGA